MTPLKAIRNKCKECSNFSTTEIRECTVYTCALYEFRFGKNPYISGRKMSDEQKEAAVKRLRGE